MELVHSAAQDIVEESTPKTGPAKELVALAIQATQEVFRYADKTHPGVAVLFKLGVRRRARAMSFGNDPGVARERLFLKQLAPGTRRPEEPMGCGPYRIQAPVVDLPSTPNIYDRLAEAVQVGRKSPQGLKDIIADHEGLESNLLLAANLGLYGEVGRIDNLERAAALIGGDMLYSLAACLVVMEDFRDVPEDLTEARAFFQHGLAAGVLARTIASTTEFGDYLRFFLAGFLHDLGRLIVFKNRPGGAARALAKAREKQVFLSSVEPEEIGYDHATAGGAFLRRWNFQRPIRIAVLNHHVPEIAASVRESAVIHLADAMSRAMGYGFSGEFFVPPIREAAWESLDLSPKDLKEIGLRAMEILDPLLGTEEVEMSASVPEVKTSADPEPKPSQSEPVPQEGASAEVEDAEVPFEFF